MPEGDTILHAARRIDAALTGREIVAIETPHPRHGRDRWPERRAWLVIRTDARRVAEVADEEAPAVAGAARAAMTEAVEKGGLRVKARVYDRAGLPCPRCDTLILARGQGDDNRTTFWCPRCQA